MRQILTLAKLLVTNADNGMMQEGLDRIAARYARATGLTEAPYTGLERHARMTLRKFPSF